MHISVRVFFVIIFFITCLSSTAAFAADANIEQKLDMALQAIEKLMNENEELRKRLSKLEEQQPGTIEPEPVQTAKTPAKPVPIDIEKRVAHLEGAFTDRHKSLLDRISIYGYSSFEFEKQIEKEGFGDKNGSFDADLFDLVFNIQVNNKLRATADVTWEHGSASEDDRGNVALEYGFAEYAFSNSLKLRAGKMFTPFGIFNEIHTAKPAYLSVKEAGSTNKPKNVIDGSPRFYPRWGVGLALQGDTTLNGKHLDYNFMISNGEQTTTNPFEEDDNRSKAIALRTRYDIQNNLQIGYSLYYDNGEAIDIMSHGVQFEYWTGNWRLLGEGVWGQRNPSPGSKFDHYGWFLQPSYHFNNGLTPYFRFEHYEPDTDISGNHGFDAVLGLNYEYNGVIFKLENNYYFGQDDSTLGTLPGNGYNEIKGAIVVGF